MARVSGVVTCKEQPKNGTIYVGLFREGEESSAPVMVTSVEEPGTYELTDVPPGRYLARAIVAGPPGRQSETDIYSYATYEPGPLVVDSGDNLAGINFNL